MSGRVGQNNGPSSPGHCPECEVSIPSGNVLVEYETGDGWNRMFAECPACEAVVHPAGY